MTLSTTTQRNDYTSSGQSSFAFTWRILAKSDILVYVDAVLKVLNTDYTILDADVNQASGGNVTFIAGKVPSSGSVVSLVRAVPQTQEVDLAEGVKMPAESLEKELDKITMLLQDLQERIGRCLAFKISSLKSNVPLPEPVANNLLRWNSAGTAIENFVISVGGGVSEDSNYDYGTGPPTSGTYAQGFRRYNLLPNAGGTIGWVCVVGGSPGTWKAWGLINA